MLFSIWIMRKKQINLAIEYSRENSPEHGNILFKKRCHILLIVKGILEMLLMLKVS